MLHKLHYLKLCRDIQIIKILKIWEKLTKSKNCKYLILSHYFSTPKNDFELRPSASF